jgi:hypothetical protein
MPLKPMRALAVAAVALLSAAFAAPAAAHADTQLTPGVARVSAVYALSAPETRTALISATNLATYTSPTGVLTRELDAVIDTPVAIGIDPMILASIRVLGSSAPESAVAWLERLDGAGNETFALAYADADLTVALQAGAQQVLTPTSFDFAIDPALFTATTTATPTPDPDSTGTPTPTEAPQTLPTTESLLAWDYTVPSVAWPEASTVIASDLDALTASGYETTLLSSGNVTRSQSSAARAAVGDTQVVVMDDALSLLFSDTVDAASIEDWQSSLALLEAAITTAAAPGASVVLAADRDSLETSPRLGITMNALEGLEGAEVVPFSATVAESPAAASVVDSPQSPARVAAALSLLGAEGSDAAFATVAENPLLITGERRLRLLATMSTAWNSYPGGWGSAVGTYLDDSADLHQAVTVVKSSDITLFADRSSLPVTVSNTLTQPVTVYITVRAATPILSIEEVSVPVTLEPESQKRGQIPVQSLANGTAQISVGIASGANVPIGQPTTVRISVYAGWETPITVALGVLVLAVFAFGIVRTVRRRRRRNDPAAPDVADDVETAAGAPGAEQP